MRLTEAPALQQTEKEMQDRALHGQSHRSSPSPQMEHPAANIARSRSMPDRDALAPGQTAFLQFAQPHHGWTQNRDWKSTRLNSSHLVISYAVFCLKKKKLDCNRCGQSPSLMHDRALYGPSPDISISLRLEGLFTELWSVAQSLAPIRSIPKRASGQ